MLSYLKAKWFRLMPMSAGGTNRSQLLRLTSAVCVCLIPGVTSHVHAQRSPSTAKTPDAVTRKLLIDPSSTSLLLGKASLIVSPLTHLNGNYVGDYQLKVTPFLFKSEKGTLLLAASDDAVRKLQAGTAIDFTGKAVTDKDGKIHVVLGSATPSSRDRGSVTFSIITDNGKMVFNTFYHFETNASDQTGSYPSTSRTPGRFRWPIAKMPGN